MLVALAVIVFVGVAVGRLVARSGRTGWAALPASALGGALSAVAVVALWGIASDLGDSSAHGYETVTTLVLAVGPAAWLAGAVLTQAVATGAARYWRGADHRTEAG